MPGGTTVDAPVARAFLAASLAAVWAGCASAPCRMNSAPAIACAAPLVPADPAGLFAAGYYYHGPRRPARRAGGAHMSLQRMIVANASFAMPGIELGRGDGWAAVFAEEPCGIEAWIGQSRQDVVTPPGEATISFARVGGRAVMSEGGPVFLIAAVGMGIESLESDQFQTYSVAIAFDGEAVFPLSAYGRLGVGTMLGQVELYAEVGATAAVLRNRHTMEDGTLATWMASVGAGLVF